MNKWYIGVDPGNNGGLALIKNDQAIEYERMPDIAGIDTFFDNAVFAAKGDEIACIFEEHKGGGPQTNAHAHKSAGRYQGIIETLCCVHSVQMHMVTPQAWKKQLGANSDKQRSINLAERLFPKAKLLFPRCTKKHDGVAEALLIAEYGRRMNL